MPWEGRASGVNKASSLRSSGARGDLLLRPLEPFLIAPHPVLLEFLSGDLTPLALPLPSPIGELPLWLVVAAGAVGMVKLDWLTWLAGRQWGQGHYPEFFRRADARSSGRSERKRRTRGWCASLLCWQFCPACGSRWPTLSRD
jgi:hypothetical protein